MRIVPHRPPAVYVPAELVAIDLKASNQCPDARGFLISSAADKTAQKRPAVSAKQKSYLSGDYCYLRRSSIADGLKFLTDAIL